LIDEAFCLAGLLKARKSLEKVANLLPASRRDAVLGVARDLSGLPDHELQKRIAKLRESAVLQINERLTQEVGRAWKELPPILQRWLGEVILRSDGNKDHQK
jgi:hypothetical protein